MLFPKILPKRSSKNSTIFTLFHLLYTMIAINVFYTFNYNQNTKHLLVSFYKEMIYEPAELQCIPPQLLCQ